MELRTKRTVASILSIFGAFGTVLTAVMVRNASKKEEDALKKINAKGDVSDKRNIYKAVVPIYMPAFIIGGATIASVISSTILSRKTEASLAAMALLADQGWRKYKDQIKDKLGFDQHCDVLKNIGKKESKKDSYNFKKMKSEDGKNLYFEEHVGFFRADPTKFALAYSDINQRLQIEDFGNTSYFAMIYNLMQACEADILDDKIDIEHLRWGWSAEELEKLYGYRWIHMKMFDTEIDNEEGGKTFTTIVWREDPILDPGNHGEAFLDKPKGPRNFLSAIPMIKGERENEV